MSLFETEYLAAAAPALDEWFGDTITITRGNASPVSAVGRIMQIETEDAQGEVNGSIITGKIIMVRCVTPIINGDIIHTPNDGDCRASRAIKLSSGVYEAVLSR